MNYIINYEKTCLFGLFLTCVLSLVLSVQLFTSVSDSRFSWLLLMGIALALEVGKIAAINDQRRIIAGLLIAVSVLGSAGGLSRSIGISGGQVNAYRQQKAQVQAEIGQNNRMIDRYISLDRLQSQVIPLQRRNRELRQQLAALPVVRASALQAALDLLADLLLLPVQWVTGAVVLLLAVLLDLLAVSFIRRAPVATAAAPAPQPPQPKKPLPRPDNVDDFSHSYQVFRSKLVKGELPLVQRECIRQGWPDKTVRRHWARLRDERLIEKRGNQFVWVGEVRQVSML